jgi:hypothetical protein
MLLLFAIVAIVAFLILQLGLKLRFMDARKHRRFVQEGLSSVL